MAVLFGENANPSQKALLSVELNPPAILDIGPKEENAGTLKIADVEANEASKRLLDSDRDPPIFNCGRDLTLEKDSSNLMSLDESADGMYNRDTCIHAP